MRSQKMRGRILAASISFLLLGCSDDLMYDSSLNGAGGDQINIFGKIEQEYVTRASDDGFVEGDCMGIFIVDYNGDTPGVLTASSNRANNAMFVLKGLVWSSSQTYYWKDRNTKVDVYGYYPYNGSLEDVESHPFEVYYDQRVTSTDGMSGYEASDFLWAKAAGEPPSPNQITLRYTHRMAGVMVTLQKGDGISDIEWEKVGKRVTVDNLTRHANINLAKGEVTATGTPDRQIVMADQGDDTYRAVVVPQNVGAGAKLLGITVDGTTYSYVRNEPLTLASGKLHRFTLRIDKKDGGDYAVKLVSQEISPWENDRLTHNFLEYEYTIVNLTSPGTLKQTIMNMGKDYSKIKNLKIVGPITTADFDFMREEMSELAMLNMKEAKCKDVVCRDDGADTQLDNYIPAYAFYGKHSLRRIILNDDLERIGGNAFRETGFDINSSIVLPSTLKRVDCDAFSYNREGGEIVMNEELEYIGDRAFGSQFSSCKFKLTDKLKTIGACAFSGIKSLEGNFYMPSHIENIAGANSDGGTGAFDGLVPFEGVGHITVPKNIKYLYRGIIPNFSHGVNLVLHDGIKQIGSTAGNCRGGLNGMKILNHLELPEGLTTIGANAFEGTVFNAGITLPSTLCTVAHRAFLNARGLGDITLPEGIEEIGGGCFMYSDLKSIVLPNSLVIIGEEAFACDVQSVTIGKNCNFIGERAFGSALRSLICLNPEPPMLDGINKGDDYYHPFGGCDLEHLVLQVPEKSVELYRNTPGWNRIRYITAYHELAAGVSELQCLDRGVSYETLVRSEGAWQVSECPDWVTVTPTSSNNQRRTEVKIIVKPTSQGTSREGALKFVLRGKEAATTVNIRQLAYEKAEDKEIRLQTASAGGQEIPVLFVGEGFTAGQIVDGTYMRVMQDACENFFAIEPYRTYRNYFTVSTAVAVSPVEGIVNDNVSHNKFDFSDRGGLDIDYAKIRRYAESIDPKFNSEKALIVVVPNHRSFFGMVNHDDRHAEVAVCGYSNDTYPYDFRGTVQHFAGGLAFGHLAPEYVTHYEFIRGCRCENCRSMGEYTSGAAKGWYKNISMSGAMSNVPWSHLIFDSRYSDITDVYEGGYNHLRGVFRSENQSCMSTYISYFNTISRQLIVERIMKLAGKEFSFESFVQRDSRAGCPQ